MSAALISARFPEPGNPATVLTLDVAPSLQGPVLFLQDQDDTASLELTHNKLARMGKIWAGT